jgi:hypothetical protein
VTAHHERLTRVINELLAGPPLDGDANCDGTASSIDDEFIEIVNPTSDVLALDRVTVSDSSDVRFAFPMGTDLAAHGVVVVQPRATSTRRRRLRTA